MLTLRSSHHHPKFIQPISHDLMDPWVRKIIEESLLHEQEISSWVVSEKGSVNERKYGANVPRDVHTCVGDDCKGNVGE
ncbi:2906_t:CDS:2 [Racocetra persica]|uniref:2905_t:CDS:1 n=2 Tax=Racocetra persica TaxID=160502 RepID=A0ACA9K8U5_9GLOM|nr:2905_t:CDS:2 [Racocetra persica]CAG8459503.1 2906_t:CDS:2 [Racocetra persica]